MSLPALVSVLVVLASGPARAAEVDCSNPQSAADTLFNWQRAKSFDPARAAACMDVPPGEQGGRLAVQFKQALDARGIYFPIAKMPDDPDYEDEDGKAVVVPLPDTLPMVAVVKGDDGKWRYSRDTVEAIPDLYAETFSAISLWLQERLPPAFHTRVLGLLVWQYFYALLLVLGSLAAGVLTRNVVLAEVNRRVAKARLPVAESDLQQANAPVVSFVGFWLFSLGLPDLQLPIRLSGPLTSLADVGMWLSALLAAYRVVAIAAAIAAAGAARTHSKLDDQAIPLMRQGGQLLVIVLGGLYVLDALGFDVWQLAAGLGIGGIAFALAAQDTVANLFGSLNIFLDRPFQIGDWVKIGDVEGVVEEVGFRSTRVRTFYNSLVTIPNSQITSANVDNLGVRHRRRIKLVVGLTYDTPTDKLQAYVEGARAILAAHPAVQDSYEVHVHNLGASAVEILVYYHVVTDGWHDELVARSQNILELIRLARTLDVSFAFPSTSIYVEATPEHPLPEPAPTSREELRAVFDSFGPGGSRAETTGPAFGSTWAAHTLGAREDRGSANDGDG